MALLLIDGNHMAQRVLHAGHVMEKAPGDAMNEVDYITFGYTYFASILKEINTIGNIDEVVLAVDSKPSWRTHIYPPYKKNRKRDNKIDWDEFNNEYDKLVTGFQENLPFKVLKIRSAEGDDIIGILANELHKRMVILSSDCDYKQCISRKVGLFDPLKRRYRNCEDPERFLVESCLQGQTKDNIYNVLTPLDKPAGQRQASMGEKKIKEIIDVIGLEKWLTQNKAHDRFQENMRVMDLKRVPEVIKTRVLDAYNGYQLANANNIYPYLMESGWTRIMDNAGNIQEKLLYLSGV